MGWCHEFGVQVRDGCDHPVTAGSSACHCTSCGVVCEGRFGGCATVWANGPRQVTLVRPQVLVGRARPAPPDKGPDAEPEPQRHPDAVVSPDDGRVEVLEWLQGAFEGLRAELRVVHEALTRQEKALAALAEADSGIDRLLELAEGLPPRIGRAVSQAVSQAVRQAEVARQAEAASQAVSQAVRQAEAARQPHVEAEPHPGPRAEPPPQPPPEVDAELRRSVAELQASAADLRNERARLAAFRETLAAD